MNVPEKTVLALDAPGGDRGLAVSVPAAMNALEADSGLHLVLDGVWVSTHALEGVPEGLVALVNSSRLRKDLSQFDVVRDDSYGAILEAVQRAGAAANAEAGGGHRSRSARAPRWSRLGGGAAEEGRPDDMEPPTAWGLGFFFGALLLIAAAVAGIVIGC